MGFKVNDFIDKKMGGMPILLQYGITPLLVNEAKKRLIGKIGVLMLETL